jgi:Reverse transcriptase (RNA-dependent DNA polymerase)
MAREFPGVRFERYVDDAVVHCVSEAQARKVLAALQERMAQAGLTLHPDKTRIVYCKDGRRTGSGEHTSFTFLGYTFRARGVRTKTGKMMTGFIPAISKDALNRLSAQVRSWGLHRRTGLSEADLARWIPRRARLDELLRRLPPVGALSPPDAHQRLPAALAAQEASAVAGTEKGTGRMGKGLSATAPVLRPLGLGHDHSCCLVIRTTRAV